MSQVLIHQYLAELSRLKRTSGSSRETIVREAFKDLLKAWGRSQDLVFVDEYPMKTATKANITVDGAVIQVVSESETTLGARPARTSTFFRLMQQSTSRCGVMGSMVSATTTSPTGP